MQRRCFARRMIMIILCLIGSILLSACMHGGDTETENRYMETHKYGTETDQSGTSEVWILESLSYEIFGGIDPFHKEISVTLQPDGEEVLLTLKEGRIGGTLPGQESAKHPENKRFLDEIQAIILQSDLQNAWTRPKDGRVYPDRSGSRLNMTFRGKETISIESDQLLSKHEKAAYDQISKMLTDKFFGNP